MSRSLAEKLARPEVLAMKAYESARSLSISGEIFLDANESPFGAPLKEEELKDAAYQKLNLYPEPTPVLLYQRLADLYQVETNKLLVVRGADEAIDLLVRTFCQSAKDHILICPPTYGVYKIAADSQGCQTVEVPLNLEDFSIDTEAILSACNSQTKLVFICSPNNPTGNSIEKQKIFDLCQKLADSSLVVVDEAYVEFSSKDSLTKELSRFENLVILRTLSKAYSLAGLRVGSAIANEQIIAILHKIRAPYPLARPVIEIALKALVPQALELVSERIAMINENKTWFADALKDKKAIDKVFASDANYLLCRVNNSQQWFNDCKSSGLILRNMTDKKWLEDCIRISIGSKEQLNTVLAALY